MRAAHKDVVIERGTTWRLAFELWSPVDTRVEADTLTPGDRVMYDGYVHEVYDVTISGTQVRLRFDTGNWTEPVLTVRTDTLFQPAELATPTAARAAYEYWSEDEDGVGILVQTEIFSAISEGSVILTLDADTTAALPVGTGTWDVMIQLEDGDWVRTLEGQFTAVPTVAGVPVLVTP